MTTFIHALKKFFIVFLVAFLTGCSSPGFYQSNAFYINDRAGALLSSTEYLIYTYSKDLDKVDSQTKEYRDQKLNGLQFVVATYLGEPDSVDTTAVFNKWKIGTNDLGFLILLYFEKSATEEYTFNHLGMTWEISDTLSSYIPMIRVEQIYQATWNSPATQQNHPGDYDYWLADFYVGVLKEIYLEVYDYASVDDVGIMEAYENDQYVSFYKYLPSESFNIHAVAWYYYVLGVIVLILILSGRWWVVLFFNFPGRNSGGGGRSGGYRYTR